MIKTSPNTRTPSRCLKFGVGHRGTDAPRQAGPVRILGSNEGGAALPRAGGQSFGARGDQIGTVEGVRVINHLEYVPFLQPTAGVKGRNIKCIPQTGGPGHLIGRVRGR